MVRLQVINIFSNLNYWCLFCLAVCQYAAALVARSKLLTCLYYRSSVQGGDPIYRKAWAKICEISRTEFSKVYQRLQVELEEKVNGKDGPILYYLIQNRNKRCALMGIR